MIVFLGKRILSVGAAVRALLVRGHSPMVLIPLYVARLILVINNK